MKRILVIFTSLLMCLGCQRELTTYVNPFVGTDGHGHTFPGAIVPFGMIQPSPDTRLEGWDGCSGYHYSDDTIYGFSHTHLSGTGCEDFGDLLLMPFDDAAAMGECALDHSMYQSHFSHSNETAAPGYYSVKLDRNDIEVELTCNERTAFHRYTFNGNGAHGFIIDLHHRDKLLSGNIRQIADTLIVGHRESAAWNPDQKLFFAIRTPIDHVDYRNDSTQAIVYLPQNMRQAVIAVSISAVDTLGALRNLQSSDFVLNSAAFDRCRHAADSVWNERLGSIEISGGSTKQRNTFYTALYHCFTAPYLFSDIDGRYRGTDDQIHTAAPGRKIYTVFSLWDTYRALHPLLTLIDKELSTDFVYTFLQNFRQGGELTMWELAANETHCMIGYHAAPVILEALRAGFIDDSLQMPLLEAMTATSNRTPAHRQYGYEGLLSSEVDHESVSKTLEYAYDDWCIATYCKLIAENNPQQADLLKQTYDTYIQRAQSWQNILDSNGFMHPRRNGGFLTPFNPTEVNNNYTEANSWQYSTYVPHDIYHWIDCLGGQEAALAMLDSLFNSQQNLSGRNQADITGLIGLYAHGNEPSHHAAYLYTYLGQPQKSKTLVHKILNTLYDDTPAGLCGNEDCGQMSAWYVISALGFYPVCPGSNEYVTVEPLFKQANVHLHNGKTLTIDRGVWPEGQFWRPRTDNPTATPDDFHAQSISRLETADRVTPVPYFGDWSQRFNEKATLALFNVLGTDPSTKIFYTLDGNTPDTNSTLYTGPFVIDHDATVKACSFHPSTGYSPVATHNITQYFPDKTLTYTTPPNPQYSEGGTELLIDRIFSTSDFRIGGWQGWDHDMEATVDLLSSKKISSVSIDCLEDTRSWILYPRAITIETSTDGIKYVPFGREDQLNTTQAPHESSTKTFKVTGNGTARYVRIKVSNYGPLPHWHISAGEPAWLFIDEITIE